MSGSHSLKRLGQTALSAAVSMLLVQSGAQAQVLEEVIVTAQKREERLQDVGISVSVLSGDQLRNLGIGNTTEITQQVPGLQVNAWSPTITTFNLRGVSQANFTDNLEAPVAVYSDEVYLSSLNAIAGQMFDMQRVEVLRGPQGTLFGRNATGGLIHYLSRTATEDELNGYVQASVGEFSYRTIEGAAGGAFSDSARWRIAGRVEEQDGYVDGTQPGVRGVGGLDGVALRGAFQFDLSDRATADLIIKYSDDSDVPTGAYVLFPTDFDAMGNAIIDPVTGFAIASGGDTPNPYQHDSDYQGRFDRETTSATLKFDVDLSDNVNLVSVTNYFTMDKFYDEDGDGIPINIITFSPVADLDQFSQELRLSGGSDRLRWQTGAYFLDIDMNPDQFVSGEGLLGSATASVFSDGDLQSQNWSIFGQIDYDLSDSLTLIAGWRWSQDDKEITLVNTFDETTDNDPPAVIFDLAQLIATTPGAAGIDEIDYGDFAARLQLDWQVNDDTLVFASWNRGIKGGNWTFSQDVELFSLKHDEETLNAIEIGFKSTLLDGRAQLNGTLFHYDYDDYQVFSLTNLTPQVNNSDATVSGGELELAWAAGDSWDFIFGLSLLDSDVDQVPTLGTASGLAAVDFISAEMPNAPGYSFNFLGRKTFNMDGGTLAIQLDGVAYDDQFLEGHNASTTLQRGYELVNARVSFTDSNDSWTIEGWIKNATDEVYRTYSIDLSILGSTSFYALPRQAGVTASFRF